MPVSFYSPQEYPEGRVVDLTVPQAHRHFFITDINGVEVEIKSQGDLLGVLAQMSPEQFEAWKLRYRFTPITKSNPNSLSGSIRDLTGT